MSAFDLRLGDCLAGMAGLADKSVDVVITDPPYSKFVHDRHGKEVRPDLRQSRDALSFEHLTPDVMRACAEGFSRLSRRWVLVFCDMESTGDWRRAVEDAGLDHVRTGAWVKEACMPQLSGDRPAAGMEGIVIAHTKGKKRWNGGGRPAVWSFQIEKVEKNRHPCQKPLPLMEALVRDFTEPGELVLDPFAGSGTTGVACIRNGRRFIGFEQDPKYHAAAMKRLSTAREQLSIF